MSNQMLNQRRTWGILVGFSLFLGTASGVLAQPTADMPEHANPQGEFQRIEQPLGIKAAVTLGGLALIGLELWWFLLSKPKAQRATPKQGIQEVTITVDGGYEPSQITVTAGQPVRLNFFRRDPSSCLEEVRFPDFHIAQKLLLNQVTPVEFTPDEPGEFTFACGMNMFRGVIDVLPARSEVTTAADTERKPS